MEPDSRSRSSRHPFGSLKSTSTFLLPPSAFSQNTAECPPNTVLLSPSKFTSPLKKAVAAATQYSISSSSESSTSPCTRRRVVSRHGKENSPVRAQQEANKEIERLRRENYRLMQDNLQRTYEYCTKAQGEGEKAKPLQSVDYNTQRHVDSLISKQAEEIKDLKAKLSEMKISHERSLTELVADAEKRECSHRQDIDSIKSQHEHELKAAEDELAKAHVTALRMKEEFEREKSSLVDKIHTVQDELEKCRGDRGNLIEKSNDLHAKLMDSQQERESMDRLVQQLRSQLTIYQERDAEQDRWPQEKKRLELKLTTASSECETLKSENGALNVRLAAIDEVLTAQQDSLRTSTSDSNQEKVQRLLHRWRYSVFQLLVQRKSQELSDRAESDKTSNLICSLKGQIQNLQSCVRELEGRLADQRGQLTILTNQKQKLESLTTELKEEITTYVVDKQKQEKTISILKKSINDLSTDFLSQMNVFHEVNKRVKQQDARLLSSCKQITRCRASFINLHAEKLQLADKLSESTNLVEVLRGQLSEKCGECEEVTERLINSEEVKGEVERKHSELQQVLLTHVEKVKEKEETISKMSEELGRWTEHVELEKKRMSLEIEREYKEKLARYENDICILKRDLAKTVVALRQAERRQESTSQHHDRQIQEITSQSRDRVESLQAELVHAQVERNVLHSNLAARTAAAERRMPRVSQSLGASPQASPAKVAFTSDLSLPTSPSRIPTDGKSLLSSVTKLAASVLDSDSDSDESVSHL